MHPLTCSGRDWSAAVSAANLLLEISAGAVSGCGFSLSNPREGRNCRPRGMRTGERNRGVGIFCATLFFL